MIDHARSLYETREQDELDVLTHWTQYGFELVNPYLRSGRIPREANRYLDWTPERLRERIETMDSLMQPLDEPLTLWRGTDMHERYEGDWREPTFISTTLDREIGERFARIIGGMQLQPDQIQRFSRKRPALLEIHVPAGHPAICLAATSCTVQKEREILLARGTSFTAIRSRKGPRGLRLITLQASHDGRLLTPGSSRARRMLAACEMVS
jgi:hypothetical protein